MRRIVCPKYIQCSDIRSGHYIRYDDRKFSVGDVISTGQGDRILDPTVARHYSSNLKLDVKDVVYLTDSESNTYDEREHCYEVYPLQRVVKVFSDYSSIMCSVELGRCIEWFIDNHHEDIPAQELKRIFIEYMFDAYTGDESAKQFLHAHFGYSLSSDIEYLCQSVKVVNVLR